MCFRNSCSVFFLGGGGIARPCHFHLLPHPCCLSKVFWKYVSLGKCRLKVGFLKCRDSSHEPGKKGPKGPKFKSSSHQGEHSISVEQKLQAKNIRSLVTIACQQLFQKLLTPRLKRRKMGMAGMDMGPAKT